MKIRIGSAALKMACYVLPESVLEHQVCSSCKNYLSYPPTKIYRSGEIKCGRCSNSDDGGTVSTTFETLARNVLFPCSSRFEGCSKMLHYMDTKRHEKTCSRTSVGCPLCESCEGSILHLIHHFKLIHPKSVLAEPFVECDVEQEFSGKHLLYFNYAINKMFLLTVSWERRVFSLNCSTAKCLSQMPTQMALLFSDSISKEDKAFHTTDYKNCLDFENSATDFEFELEIPPHLTKIGCKMIFVQPMPLLEIPEFRQVRWNQDRFKRVSRKLHLDNDFKKSHNIESTESFKLSPCGRKLEHQDYSLSIACDFCENLLANSKSIWHASHQCYVCGECYHRGVQKSLDNKGVALEELEDGDYQLIQFYCKHGCGKFLRSGELFSHEDQCGLNDKRSLSDEEYMIGAFGNDFEKGDKFVKGNVISDAKQFKGTGKICMATRDNFKCIINYEEDSSSSTSRCNFHINHNYDAEAYYVSVHKWEDGKYSEDFNDFSMKVNVNNNCDGPSSFAVILKELQED